MVRPLRGLDHLGMRLTLSPTGDGVHALAAPPRNARGADRRAQAAHRERACGEGAHSGRGGSPFPFRVPHLYPNPSLFGSAPSEPTAPLFQASAIKTAGTKVTVDSFNEWKVRFEQEMKDKDKKDEADRIKALPPKEREEVKKFIAKYTGAFFFFFPPASPF